MNRKKVEEILNCLGVDAAKEQKRKGWLVAHCPLGPWEHGGADKNPSFGVREENGDNFCHCWSCGWGGPISELVIEIGAKNKLKKKAELDIAHAMKLCEGVYDELDFDTPGIEDILFGKKANEFFEFPGWWLQGFTPVAGVKWAADYLKSRKVPQSLWSQFDLRADTWQKRVCLPVYDFNKRLAGLHGRAVDPDNDLRYRMYTYAERSNPEVWYGEHYVDFDKPVVFVEGYFDLLSVYRVYRNVVSPLFANPSFDKLNRLGDVFEVITLYDQGAGGDKGREKVSKGLKKGRIIRHLKPPGGVKDPGEMTTVMLVETLGKFVELDQTIVA